MPGLEKRRVRKGRRGIPVLWFFATFASFALTALSGLAAQQPAAPTDQAAVDRGEQLLRGQCGFCHGVTGRGGSGGPDLTRSALVQEDEDGKQLGAFLQTGRPDRGMPRFDLAPDQNTDLAAFLHAAIYLNANRRLYKILDVLVGDAKAGEAYFSGTGRCNTCHSATGDLKGIGSKYDPAALQNRMLMPRGRPASPGETAPPLHLEPTAISVTVSPPSGGPVTGALVRLTDFEVSLWDSKENRQRTWLRHGESPKVALRDPLQAHMDLLPKWTDADMHNVTAYLAGLTR